jgi:orotidine-5'-phosphate decarboxylase
MSPMTTTARELPERLEDRLIVALDVPSISEARALIDKLDGVVSFFKVGLWLQFAPGFDGLLDYLIAKNKNIFPVLLTVAYSQAERRIVRVFNL